MKEKYYLIETAGDRMGSGDSYEGMTETELFKEKNLRMLSDPHYSIYEKVDRKKLLKKKNSIVKSAETLRLEALEVAKHKLGLHSRMTRYGGILPKDYWERKKELEEEINALM